LAAVARLGAVALGRAGRSLTEPVAVWALDRLRNGGKARRIVEFFVTSEIYRKLWHSAAGAAAATLPDA